MDLAQFAKINIVELYEVISAIKITDFEEKITRFYSPSIGQDTKGKSAPWSENCTRWVWELNFHTRWEMAVSASSALSTHCAGTIFWSKLISWWNEIHRNHILNDKIELFGSLFWHFLALWYDRVARQRWRKGGKVLWLDLDFSTSIMIMCTVLDFFAILFWILIGSECSPLWYKNLHIRDSLHCRLIKRSPPLSKLIGWDN